MFPGIVDTAIAIAILLSAVVRLIRTGASWAAIDEGVAGIENLREITGVTQRDKLMEMFGLPRMDGVWPVTRAEVKRQRTAIGYLMGDRWLDRGCIVIALVALFPIWPIWTQLAWLEGLLMLAGLYQAAGWMATMGLLSRR